MDRTERFYRIDQLLNDRRSVALNTFVDDLGVSRATVKRDLEYMRERLHAPIVWDRSLRGYLFGKPDPSAPKYELPGLWFSSDEIHALLTMHQLLSNLGEGVLTPHVKPLLTRLNSLLGSQNKPADEVRSRIRILHMASRSIRLPHFETVASATLKRLRLHIRYRARSTDAESEREVSPQRLVHYRDNWYLDGWCHLRKGLRSFSVDAVQAASILDKKAKSVSEKTLNDVLASGYGIFSGQNLTWATLRFTPEQARWVAAEQWHPEQKGSFDDAGFYLLEFPYSNDRELIMDILKYGPEVEVLAPARLRSKVQHQLQVAADQYQT